MSQPEDRRAVYADVLAGLRDLGADAPVGRFDALVDDLLAAGRLTADEGAALRFWQREALRNQADHLVSTAAATLSALDASRAATEESIRSAGRTWDHRNAADQPGPGTTPAATPDTTPDTTPATGPRHAAPARVEASAEPFGAPTLPPAAAPAPRAASAEPRPTRDAGRHRADDPAPPPTRLDLALAPAADTVRPPAASPAPEPVDHEPADASARRRRLLVAGLTVIDEVGTHADERDASGRLAPHPSDDRPAVG